MNILNSSATGDIFCIYEKRGKNIAKSDNFFESRTTFQITFSETTFCR